MEKIVNSALGNSALVIELPDMTPAEFIAYYNSNKEVLEAKLHTAGILKFAGVEIITVEDFQGIANAISSKFLSYIDGNSPRTKLTGTVYTSTEYDSTQRITMHNELSYSAKWPHKLFFTCLTPAESGGETLLADSREILRAMDSSIVEEIERKGITYIRNLHSGQGMGPSWQDTFECKNKVEVEQHCKEYSIDYEWGPHDSLKVKHFSQGIIQHKYTGDKVWFNQIDQFHPSHLGEEMFEVMQQLYESPENFPMYVRFGDGSEISEQLVKQILHTIDSVTTAPRWEKNELVILDNELMSHGRNPYTGDRKVLVSMSE